MTLHEFLDSGYGTDGDTALMEMLTDGADPNARDPATGETPLLVAARRFRTAACAILLDYGAAIDLTNADGKTAFAHARRRGFAAVADLLTDRGANTALNEADQFAVAVIDGRLDDARAILAAHPGVVRTGVPEEDRLLADVAGRQDSEPVTLLIESGADLTAPGLDGGTPLHQAAWFGQPQNARLLIAAGAPLDIFDPVHHSSPIGWVAHGSRYSGGAAEREDRYVELARILLDAGASLEDPDEFESEKYRERLLHDASERVAEVIRAE